MKPSIIFLLLFFGFATENSFAQPKVGEPAPKIQFSTAIGKPQSADFTKGKYVVLEFWATWCAPCVGGFPHFNSLIKKFASDSVVFVSITDETDAVHIKNFLTTKARLDAINLLDDNKKTFKAFNITGIPTTVVMDKNGNVLWAGHVTELTAEKLENLLKGKDLPKAHPAAAAITTPSPTEEGQKKTNVLEFSLKKVATPPANQGASWGTNKGQRYYAASYTSLSSSLSKVYEMPATRVLLSKELVDYPMLELKFTIDTAVDRKTPNMISDLVLKTLNLSAKVVTRDTMIWQIEVTDSKLLNKYKSGPNGHTSYAANETQLVVNNHSLKRIGEYLENYFKTLCTALPDASTKTNGEQAKGFGYDLILPRLKSFDELNTWLKKNIGIHFVKQAQAVKFLQVTTGTNL